MAPRRTPDSDVSTGEDIPMATPPDAPVDFSIFETVKFPGRGRSGGAGEMDARYADAVLRRAQWIEKGAPADKILNVVDLSSGENESEAANAKEVNKFRSALVNACKRVDDNFVIEWRAVPADKTAMFIELEQFLGGDQLSNATHTFRITPGK